MISIQESQNKGNTRKDRQEKERMKTFLKKGRRMGCEGRGTVETKTTEKGDKKAELQRVTDKEEITSTEFPEGGNTTFTKGLPASQRGEKLFYYSVTCDMKVQVYWHIETGEY